ncbi:MAG TPA: hypothetical protein PLW93_01090 [Candidatus Absconditabacterales bacterium]|nr:hypothetical protein [Candidatus Absconditabacterales bacterium]HNG96847.1 hypothetical protein [Candidatus Absconditabacterales bacterium]
MRAINTSLISPQLICDSFQDPLRRKTIIEEVKDVLLTQYNKYKHTDKGRVFSNILIEMNDQTIWINEIEYARAHNLKNRFKILVTKLIDNYFDSGPQGLTVGKVLTIHNEDFNIILNYLKKWNDPIVNNYLLEKIKTLLQNMNISNEAYYNSDFHRSHINRDVYSYTVKVLCKEKYLQVLAWQLNNLHKNDYRILGPKLLTASGRHEEAIDFIMKDYESISTYDFDRDIHLLGSAREICLSSKSKYKKDEIAKKTVAYCKAHTSKDNSSLHSYKGYYNDCLKYLKKHLK